MTEYYDDIYPFIVGQPSTGKSEIRVWNYVASWYSKPIPRWKRIFLDLTVIWTYRRIWNHTIGVLVG